mgnify:CR=1 FL=1
MLAITLSCNKQSQKKSYNLKSQNEEIEMFLLGDINIDGILDTAYVLTPKHYLDSINQFDSCLNNNCFNVIKFSSKYKDIVIKNSIWGKVETLDDLDNDGIKEILFQTNWWIGTRVRIYIYSYNRKIKNWVILAENKLYEEESYKYRISKINNEKFNFKIEYYDTIEYDFKNKIMTIPIKK